MLRCSAASLAARKLRRAALGVLCAALWTISVTVCAQEYPSLDGVGNNLGAPSRGAVGSPFVRRMAAAYQDGVGAPLAARRDAWNTSRAIFSAPDVLPRRNRIRASALLPMFGLLLTHDVVSSRAGAEPFNIPVPCCHPSRDPGCFCNGSIPFTRLASAPNATVRTPVNDATAFIDASFLYGTSVARANALRTMSGGELRTDPGDRIGLPFNDQGPSFVMHDGNPADVMLTGDARGNTHPGVLALNAVFVREHNRVARSLAARNASLTDEQLFQEARLRVMAVVQRVAIEEYLPTLLGARLPRYAGYNASVDPSIDVFFAAAAFRYGHSSIDSVYPRLSANGSDFPLGPLLSREHFFSARFLREAAAEEEPGVEPLLRGLLALPELDMLPALTRDAADHLLVPGSPPLRTDLGALDLQRQADLGIPLYNDARVALGLPPATTFAEVTSDSRVALRLAEAFGFNVSLLDALVGGRAEDRNPALSGGVGLLGPLFARSVAEQFARLRDGDRFWYERRLSAMSAAEATEYAELLQPLGAVIERNMRGVRPQRQAFRLPPTAGGTVLLPPANVSDGQLGVAGNVELTWELSEDGDAFTFTLRVDTRGWMALGFGRNMLNADIISVAVPDSGPPLLVDATSTGNVPPQADTVLGGSSNVEAVSLTQTGGRTTATFRRNRSTGDPLDVVLNPGRTPLMFAFHPSDDTPQYHGPASRTVVEVDLFTQSRLVLQVDSRRSTIYYIHGLGMFLIWGLVVPASIFVARYVKSHPNWIVVHRALMTVVTSTTLPLLATALNANNAVVRTRHAVVGVVVGGCVLLNVFLGHASFVSLQAVANQKLSRFVRGLHATLGWALMAMSIYMLQSGAALLDPALEGYFWAWFALTVASFLFFDVLWMTELLACLGRFRCCRDLCGVAPPDDAAGPAEAAAVGALRKEPALRRSDQRLPTVLPLFTVEDLKREIFRGAKWLTIDDRVYNIEEFIGAHPGGAKVLESVLGKDIGRFFFGMQKLDMPGTVRHSHSRHAQRRLERMLVGLLTLNPAQSSLFPAAQALDLDIQEAARSTRNAERAARKPASVVDLAGKPELAPRRVRLVRRELLSDEPSGAVARLVFSEEDALGGDAGAGAGASAGAGAKPAASSPSALSATAAAAGAALSKPVIELVEIAEHKQQQQQQPAEQQLPQQPRQPSESGEAARAARVESADGLEMNPMHLQAVAEEEEEEDDGLFGLPRFVNSFGQNYRVSSVIKGERIHRFYSVVRTNLPLDAEDAAAAAATAAARAAAAGEEKRDASPRAGGGGGDAAAAAAAAAANGGGEARVVVQLSPLGERELALVVKRYPTGLMSRLLHALSPGETISLEGPRGIGVPFSVIDRCKHITLIAAGTGLLPFLDLVDVVCRRARAGRGRHRVPCLSVLCSFRSDRSIIGREWLEARAREAELCRDAFADVATPLPRGRSLQPQPQPHPQLPPAASPSAAPTRVDSLSDHGRGPERTNSASPSPQHSPRRLPTPQRAPQRSASSRDALPPALRVFITVQHPTRTWAGNVGYFDRKLLKRLVPRATDAIYVCGSEAFNNQVRDLLLRLGFAPDDVHTM